MLKKIFSITILSISFFMPIFWVQVYLPKDVSNDDINITTSAEEDYKSELPGSGSNTQVSWKEDTIYKAFNVVNSHLWRSFSIICTAMVIYWWFCLITANWDKKALKRAMWVFIWTGIWICIAMVSYAVVNLLTNIGF
jgi:hypothetical protein